MCPDHCNNSLQVNDVRVVHQDPVTEKKIPPACAPLCKTKQHPVDMLELSQTSNCIMWSKSSGSSLWNHNASTLRTKAFRPLPNSLNKSKQVLKIIFRDLWTFPFVSLWLHFKGKNKSQPGQNVPLVFWEGKNYRMHEFIQNPN